MSCILRISGDLLDIEALLSQHSLTPDSVWKKGASKSAKGKSHSDSGANFLISDATLGEFSLQLNEAINFLKLNLPMLAQMVAFPGVQNAVLDFGIVALKPGKFAQFTHLPAEFIQLASNAGVAVEISQYACSNSDV